MSAPLVFMDTETTGLALTDDIWEFAAIRREPDGVETEYHCFVEHNRVKCAQLPMTFRNDHYNRFLDHKAYTQAEAASLVRDIFRNGTPHVVGAVPNFDTERLTILNATYSNQRIGWHYHLIDVENLAVGFIAGQLAEAKARNDKTFTANPSMVAAIAAPWDSDKLSAALGVWPDQFERHTAMGDVRWAMAIYDAVMGGAS